MEPPREFTYDQLQTPSSIRLIEINKTWLPSKLKPLSLAISTFHHDNAPPYDALSYTWGNPMVPHSRHYNPDANSSHVRIELNGGIFVVTKNLADALNKMRTGKTATSRYVWADAICINQNDPSEKAAQVTRMDVIYTRAERVLVYLGDADEFTNDAVAALKTVSRIPPDRYGEVRPADWFDQGRVFTRLGAGQSPKWQHWLGLVLFFDRPWFKRVWIIQEVVLGRNVVVVCGDHIFPWDWIQRTLEFLGVTQWNAELRLGNFRANENIRFFRGVYKPLLQGEASVDLGNAAMYLQGTKEGIQKSGNLALFRYLIGVFRHSDAGDPRDKIFSLLGIARKDRPPFSTHPGQLVPDYRLDIEAVYTRTARMMLEGYKDLRFFDQVEDATFRNINTLPSWVPDYSARLLPETWFGLARGSPVFKASADIPWSFDQTPLDSRKLAVQGFCLDTIATALPYSLQRNANAETDAAWVEIIHFAKEIGREQREATETKTRFEVLWRTILIDLYDKKQPAPPICGELFFELLAWQAALICCSGEPFERWGPICVYMSELLDEDSADSRASSSSSSSSMPDRESFKRVFETALSANGHHPDYRARFTQLIYDLSTSLACRRMVLTKDKRLAVAPLSSQTGDEVWILGGSAVPVILRKVSEGCYKLLGQAYVHGVMHGEAVGDGMGFMGIILI
ncbi:hypothetical protein OQA88_1394 [Cercophora sp. LCS_1]